jgi:hypothetical protein
VSSTFELAVIGGPWARRLDRRRAWIGDLPWDEPLPRDDEAARLVWTRTAFSEYASAAAFAEIATAMLAAGAPIDLIAAAGDFVVDELVHTEVAARLAGALGGAVALEVDLTRLVRPVSAESAGDPIARAAELIVRTSCVGEALTVPMLKQSRQIAGSALVEAALSAIIADEASHAQLGWWFLDWAEPALDDAARERLGRVAGAAIRSFAPLLAGGCSVGGDGRPGGAGSRGSLGVLGCDRYDRALVDSLPHAVVGPLARRGIAVPPEDLAAVRGPSEPEKLGQPAGVPAAPDRRSEGTRGVREEAGAASA